LLDEAAIWAYRIGFDMAPEVAAVWHGAASPLSVTAKVRETLEKLHFETQANARLGVWIERGLTDRARGI
jgi:hypothetical protein